MLMFPDLIDICASAHAFVIKNDMGTLRANISMSSFQKEQQMSYLCIAQIKVRETGRN